MSDGDTAMRMRLLELHRELVEIESLTGHEHAVGEFLVHYLNSHGFRTNKQAVPPRRSTATEQGRCNILAWPNAERDQGPSSPPTVLITTHIDTVPPHIPYSIQGPESAASTLIKGRGSADAKGSAAAQIIAVEELLAAGQVRPQDIMLLFVVGEEEGGDGMRHFSRVLNDPSSNHSDILDLLPSNGFKAAIFGEPTENRLAKGHKGLLICNVKAKGRAGHSGYPWLGHSANELMLRALVKVLDEDLGSSEQFGHTTVNVGLLKGGAAGNVIAEDASASLVMRLATGPEETGHLQVKARLLEILRDVDENAFTVEWLGGYGAVPCFYEVDGK